MSYPRIASLKTADQFLDRLTQLGITLPFDRALDAPGVSTLGQRYEKNGVAVGNRFCILPMEGWDGTFDGRPTDLTQRRWQHFGASGAKLIWGGEAFAVRHDGRANPNQLANGPHAEGDLAALRQTLVAAHDAAAGSAADLFVGLQLTHSGRYARPNPGGGWEPMTAYVHPVLDRRFPGTLRPHLFTDGELDALIGDFVSGARVAQRAGFDFVDVKHCHGYLGHELLSAASRPGKYGGPEGRTAFLRAVAAGIRQDVPGLRIGVRLSAFDAVPYRQAADGVGVPEVEAAGYRSAFGLLADPSQPPSLDDARAFLRALVEIGIDWVCVTAGSPYYNPHIQRPALFPPSDGYDPPEDPLVGVARQIAAVSVLKPEFPSLAIVGSGYSYLQEWLPHVAQAAVRGGHTDFVGLGRMVLSYPEMPRDVLSGRPLKRAMVCRTFSDCTSGPRNGLVSGCFPLDPFYKQHPHAVELKAAKDAQSAGKAHS
jgi:2,4-dienoyl-CoA reductase-like NADH-dependent reductase (Old Yellow Enzyme family)